MRMRKKRHTVERISACADIVLQNAAEIGKMREKFPCSLEIGCGKGDFAVAASQQITDMPFIALEKCADAAVLAIEKAKAAGCDNLKFIIGDAENLSAFFQHGDISRIYLNFSDPWPKARHYKRRLTFRRYLELYKTLMTDDGVIIFKTDNRALFDFSLEEFKACGFRLENITNDLHASEFNANNIQTEYERNFSAKGFTINRVEAYIR